MSKRSNVRKMSDRQLRIMINRTSILNNIDDSKKLLGYDLTFEQYKLILDLIEDKYEQLSNQESVFKLIEYMCLRNQNFLDELMSRVDNNSSESLLPVYISIIMANINIIGYDKLLKNDGFRNNLLKYSVRVNNDLAIHCGSNFIFGKMVEFTNINSNDYYLKRLYNNIALDIILDRLGGINYTTNFSCIEYALDYKDYRMIGIHINYLIDLYDHSFYIRCLFKLIMETISNPLKRREFNTKVIQSIISRVHKCNLSKLLSMVDDLTYIDNTAKKKLNKVIFELEV